MMKKIILLVMVVINIPIALADSVFANPAFDTVLILIFGAVIFFAIRELIKKMK